MVHAVTQGSVMFKTPLLYCWFLYLNIAKTSTDNFKYSPVPWSTSVLSHDVLLF